MRLFQLLLDGGYAKKRIHQLFKGGKVLINSQSVFDDAIEVDGQLHEVLVDGAPFSLKQHHYYLMNKPKGMVCAVKDAAHPTVCDRLPKGVVPIGRLDRNTEGLLILTDNGQLCYRLPLPQYHVTKKYRVVVNGALTEQMVTQFMQGIEFIGGICCAPAKLDIISSSETMSEAFVTLTEGKFHQVKKMFLAVDRYVLELQRIEYGPLCLGHDLQPGQFRALTPSEVKMLWDCAQLQY